MSLYRLFSIIRFTSIYLQIFWLLMQFKLGKNEFQEQLRVPHVFVSFCGKKGFLFVESNAELYSRNGKRTIDIAAVTFFTFIYCVFCDLSLKRCYFGPFCFHIFLLLVHKKIKKKTHMRCNRMCYQRLALLSALYVMSIKGLFNL